MGRSINALGWTILTPSGAWHNGFSAATPANTTNIIYCSNSSPGSDSNDGSLAAPYKTIAFARSKMRNGSPDWLLLRKGDTWTDEQLGSGPVGVNANELMVFSSYNPALPNNPPIPNPGSGGARPHLKTALGATGIGSFQLCAVMGLFFHSYKRDTNIVGWTDSPVPTGIDTSAGGAANLIEDNEVAYYGDGIHLKGCQHTHLRRNVIRNAWSGGISCGIKCDTNSPDFFLYQNHFDHCGWDEIGNPGQSLNHNMYFNANYIPSNPVPPDSFVSDLTIRENISSNDPFGSQGRAGGLWDNNLWIGGMHWIGGNYPHSIGATNPAIPTNMARNCVYFQFENGLVLGQGSVPDSDGNVPQGKLLVDNCIFTQAEQIHNGAFGGFLNVASNGAFSITYNNSIMWKAFAFELVGGTSGIPIKTGYYILDYNGANNQGSPEPFPFPNRTLGSYLDVILGGSGHTTQNYIDLCRAQSKDNWNDFLTAGSVNDYIREGFGRPFIGSSYAGGSIPTIITISPASLSGGTIGVPYSQTFSASGGTGSYTFAVVSGTLPNGLTLTSGGLLNGTPTVAGTFNFTVRATDSVATTADASYSVTIILNFHRVALTMTAA